MYGRTFDRSYLVLILVTSNLFSGFQVFEEVSSFTILVRQDACPRGRTYRSSKWHYRQRKIIFELIMHFIADTDTDENDFGIIIFVADADTAVLCSFEGAA